MKNFLKTTWLWIYGTKLGKLCISLFLSLICLVLSQIWEIFTLIALIFMIYPIGIALVLTIYGWVINPYNRWKEKQNKK